MSENNSILQYDSNSGKIILEIKTDGVYLTVENSKIGNKKISFDETSRYIKTCGVQDWDFLSVSEVLAESVKNNVITRRISENTVLAKVNESVEVELSADRMTSTIILLPPGNGGDRLTVDAVVQALTKEGVVKGIDREIIEKALLNPNYNVPFAVAKGIPPTQGVDGYLEFNFDAARKKPIPKLLDDGTVDFHQLNMVEIVEKGNVLVKLIPPVDGEDGFTVLGVPLPAAKGKSVALPKGKNVVVSEDGLSLIADIDGQVVYYDKQVHVLPTLEIKGDVGPGTGDIKFVGSVFVGGNVLTGFSIISNGDIEIMGVVEGAYIETQGNLIIHSGVQGMGKAFINIQGNLSAKFIEHSRVHAGGNVSADAIMHSDVECDGFLEVNGKKGLLVGGNISVQEQIVANVIGSRMATQTVLNVGIRPEIVENYNILKQRLADQKRDFEALNNNRLHTDPENKIGLIRIVKEMSNLREAITLTCSQLDELLPSMQQEHGTIMAYTCIHPGVEITLGNRALRVHTQITRSVLKNDGEKIAIDPLLK